MLSKYRSNSIFGLTSEELTEEIRSKTARNTFYLVAICYISLLVAGIITLVLWHTIADLNDPGGNWAALVIFGPVLPTALVGLLYYAHGVWGLDAGDNW
jgi:phosphotransferase system  glucose/maltose/N-acetylglucosamine-specific IIC component